MLENFVKRDEIIKIRKAIADNLNIPEEDAAILINNADKYSPIIIMFINVIEQARRVPPSLQKGLLKYAKDRLR